MNKQSTIPSTDVIQLSLTLKMTTAQVVETSVTVNNNSQDYVHPDDQTQPTFEMTPVKIPFSPHFVNSRSKFLLRNSFFFFSTESCPIPMDTTFIIDLSVCDDSSNWNRLLYFVQTLVNYFNVSSSGGRIALITFSTDAKVVLKFNTLSGSFLNSAEINRLVGSLQCQQGYRRIDKALDLADKEVLTPAGGVRDVSKVFYL